MAGRPLGPPTLRRRGSGDEAAHVNAAPQSAAPCCRMTAVFSELTALAVLQTDASMAENCGATGVQSADFPAFLAVIGQHWRRNFDGGSPSFQREDQAATSGEDAVIRQHDAGLWGQLTSAESHSRGADP
jgi:hypothetical protein